MEKSARITELDLDRWDDDFVAQEKEARDPDAVLEIFSLSAGVMKPGARTANRIDGLLARMLENPSSCKYVKDIDKNLDYLFTHLQLDMIGRVAKETASREQSVVEAPPEEPEPEPAISLDRARSSV